MFHKLVWNGDFYYMVGVFDNGKRVGTFRMDRIMRRPDILVADALPFPADFDFDKYLQTSFRMYGTKFTTVDTICKNDVMDAILDKFGKGNHFIANKKPEELNQAVLGFLGE